MALQTFGPLHATPTTLDPAFAVVLVLAGLGSSAVIGLALAALVRRRSWSYLLVTLAVATVFLRTAVAFVTMTGGMALSTHHLVEHALDVAMIALVVAAVLTARSARRAPGGETS